MLKTALQAINPLEGRYAEKTMQLKNIFSEFALQRYRLYIEIRWLEFLQPDLSIEQTQQLMAIYAAFTPDEACEVKRIEQKTAHDVKAIEYYLRQKIVAHDDLKHLSAWIHFACTSDDINNLAYGLMLKTAREEVMLPILNKLLVSIKDLAHTYAAQPMLARTHGQAATPTTVGKEFANVAARLARQISLFSALPIYGKLNGATGNFNAQQIALPTRDWPQFVQTFVQSLGLDYQAYTTQIEPHDYIAEWAHSLMRIHHILIDNCRDIWGYISLNYFTQRTVADEIGSSTMPHKINPIDFENAEGNFYLANALWQCLADKLPISRWQRDLVDSTLMRNLGVAVGYGMVAYQALAKGLTKLQINTIELNQTLAAHWEILGEAVQTVMRLEGIEEAYEQLKTLTRGKFLTQTLLHEFIEHSTLSIEAKQRLKTLTPASYVGLAQQLAQSI